MIQLGGREVLYNILIEFGIAMKLVRLVKMCLNETYSRFRVGKHLSDTFPIKNGLKQGDACNRASTQQLLIFNWYWPPEVHFWLVIVMCGNEAPTVISGQIRTPLREFYRARFLISPTPNQENFWLYSFRCTY
jgi:hypothetical protein